MVSSDLQFSPCILYLTGAENTTLYQAAKNSTPNKLGSNLLQIDTLFRVCAKVFGLIRQFAQTLSLPEDIVIRT